PNANAQQPAHAGGDVDARPTALRVAGLLQHRVRKSSSRASSVWRLAARNIPEFDRTAADQPASRRLHCNEGIAVGSNLHGGNGGGKVPVGRYDPTGTDVPKHYGAAYILRLLLAGLINSCRQSLAVGTKCD